ncbi:hypothetical protein VNI00_007334 [Paramarasmius palmivorus]|uniref:Uncharacterized protein n=1 Tax=Paramarasmius palmivorus TaxID=297713 RepID=A0AAW0D2M2_9AGAR
MPESIPPTPKSLSNLNVGDSSSSSQPAARPRTITPPPCGQPRNVKAESSLGSFSSESSNVPTPPCAQPRTSTTSVTANMSPPLTASEGYLMVVRYNARGVPEWVPNNSSRQKRRFQASLLAASLPSTASATSPTPTLSPTPSNTMSDIIQGAPSKHRKLDCNSASETSSRILVPVAGPSSSSYTVPVTLALEQPEGEDQATSPPRLPSSPVEISSPHLLIPREASVP